MKKYFFSIFIICGVLQATEWQQTAVIREMPIPREAPSTYQDNAKIKKMWHWYRHHCYQAVIELFNREREQLSLSELSLEIPIVAMSLAALGQNDSAEQLVEEALNNEKIVKNDLKNQTPLLHVLAMSYAAHKHDWNKASKYFRTLDSSQAMNNLPSWGDYTAALIALHLKEGDRAIEILEHRLASVPPEAPDFSRLTFLLGTAHLQNEEWNGAHEAFTLVLENKNADHLRPLAAKGDCMAMQAIMQNQRTPKERAALRQQLLDEYQIVLDYDEDITSAERAAICKQQAQIFTEMLRYEDAECKLKDALASSPSERERALILLKLGLAAYRSRQDDTGFCMAVEEALRLDPALAKLRCVQLSLYNMYDHMAKYNPHEEYDWDFYAGQHLVEAYYPKHQGLRPPIPPSELHTESALRLANILYGRLQLTPGQRLLLRAAPESDKEMAEAAAKLYLIYITAKGTAPMDPLVIQRGIQLAGFLGDQKVLELYISVFSKDELVGSYKKEKSIVEALQAYFSCRKSEYQKACAQAAPLLAAEEPLAADLATLVYASSVWRDLEAKGVYDEKTLLPALELLAQLRGKRNPLQEPIYVEAAIEYALASALMYRNHPHNLEVSGLLIDRVRNEYIDDKVLEGRNYWTELRRYPSIMSTMDLYLKLFEANNAQLKLAIASKYNNFGDQLEAQRTFVRLLEDLMAHHPETTHYILLESQNLLKKADVDYKG